MPLRFTTFMVVAGLCLMVAGMANAAVTTASHATYAFKRCSTCTEVRFPTEQECRAAAFAEAQRIGATREAGSATYTCITRFNVIATFRANAPAPVDCVVSEWGAWSDPAWLACADGVQSRSIVRTRTIVTQPANGGAACPSLVETQPQTRVCPGMATLPWTHDGLNTTAYRVIYWREGDIALERDIPGNTARSHTLTGLAAGEWSFQVMAVNCPPNQGCAYSARSAIQQKAVQ